MFRVAVRHAGRQKYGGLLADNLVMDTTKMHLGRIAETVIEIGEPSRVD
jgi:hypothetical protein